MIVLDSVSKNFPGASHFAVRDLSLEVHEGEMVALVGPSGCGKTTTLKMINRLIEPTSGSIFMDGRNILKNDPVQLRRGIGYVIQSVGLLPHKTIRQNIATVPRLLGWDRSKIDARVQELMEMLSLDGELLSRFPAELSGGQRQRVGVARALAVDPPVMLMDEPFGAVDPIVRARLQDQFLELQQTLRKTIIFVTHDIDEAIKMSDRIAILNKGGVLERYDTPEAVLREPGSEFVAMFVGEERGLKRLALIKVADIELEAGPVVSSSDAVEEALAKMAAADSDWASVLEKDQLKGWVESSALIGHSLVSEVTPVPFAARVTPTSSLREALDSIVTSRTRVAVVTSQDGRYLGTLTAGKISKEIAG